MYGELTLSRWLLSIHGGHCSVLRTRTHTWIHTIHRLLVTLLRSLAHHHWCTASWAWISVDPRSRRRSITGWHELSRATWRENHLGASRSHSLGSEKSLVRILHHDGAHRSLLWHELSTSRQRAKLRLHLWRATVRHHLLVV